MIETQDISTNIWTRVVKMSEEEIVKLQLIMHCYISSLQLTPLAIDVLTIIGVRGVCDLSVLVNDLAKSGMFSEEQGARNMLSRLEDAGLVVKEWKKGGTKNKIIYLHPSIGIQNRSPIYVEIKAVCQEQVED